jgi:hypothetical protein
VDALTNRLGTRFLVVTVVPNILLVGYIGFLVAAGAPAHSPSLARAITTLDGLTVRQIVAVLFGVLIISIATHPLQEPLIQLVEGYWRGLPFGLAAASFLTKRFESEMSWAKEELRIASGKDGQLEWATKQVAAEARRRLHWLPEDEEDLLPTELGNTLRIGEIRAGERYGLLLDDAMSRLSPVLSPSSLADLRDRRNQLDAAVRLCIAAGLATAVGVGLLLRHGSWLFLAVVTYLLCWACYRAAVAAARGFSIGLAAAVDLHHLQLYDALQLERPANLARELEFNKKTLGRLFHGDQLSRKAKDNLRYLPAPDNKTEEKAKESAEKTDSRGD